MLLLSFGLANGQNAISVTAVAGTYGSDGPDANSFPDTARTGQNIVFTIRYNISGATVLGSTNGWVVYSPDGAVWDSTKLDTIPGAAPYGTIYDGGVFFFPIDTPNTDIPATEGTDSNGYVENGPGPDTVGWGGSSIGAPHFLASHSANILTLTVKAFPGAEAGKHVCLDSARYSPAQNEWLWASTAGGIVPAWDGPHCFELYLVPNECPVFTNCPTSLNFDHCSPATYDFNATDPEGDPFTFAKVSGPGTVNAGTGVWNYSPTLADVGASLSLVVSVTDGVCGGSTNCTVSLNFTNVCPTFTSGCGASINVGKGNPINHDFNASSNDCDPISFYIDSLPASVNAPTINAGSGLLSFLSDVSEGGQSFVVKVGVTDTKCSTTCYLTINVLQVEPYEVQIEKTHGTHQGGHELVCVTLNKGSEQVWGFDFLIAYDQTALSFVGAIPGDIYDLCGWEYFNYRHGANGNCSNACPSGLLRVVGLAETNNGPNHPDCYLPALPVELFCLDFLVTNDRTFECMYAPVRFFWVDCGDNTISYNPSDDPTGFVQALAVSREIHEFDGVGGNLANGNTGFPTYYGAQDVCLEGGGDGKPAPIRFIDFINGGVDIVCADSIDDRGDINLNGLSNEVADAVLFTNYFVYGMGVFTVNPAGQIAATDVNADGIVLSVADLVYLIRIVIGDALAYPKLTPVESVIKNQGGRLSIEDVQVGAASIVLSGRATPSLEKDAAHMLLEFAYDGANNVTRSLIYSRIEGATESQSFTGTFLNTNGADIVSVEMATSEGAPIVAKEIELPTHFALDQNYPNPFNPTTRIRFALPTASEFTLTIYNVTGQKVTEINGSAQAGFVERDVDLGNNASGVYFYKLVAGKFTQTKKMVLLK
jgi:hypothetical protein